MAQSFDVGCQGTSASFTTKEVHKQCMVESVKLDTLQTPLWTTSILHPSTESNFVRLLS